MDKRKAFTLVELLTVIVIIALLVGLLLPSIAMVRRKAKETSQRAQFAAIETALDAFKQDYGDWPPSGRRDAIGSEYNGSMKLAEALLGWDLRGFHPKVTCTDNVGCWRRDGLDATGGPWTYDPPLPPAMTRARGTDTLFERKGPYLDTATTPAFHIGISGAGKNDGLYVNTFALYTMNYVICDVFGVRKITVTDPVSGNVIKTVTAGSPILYYKAYTASKSITVGGTVDDFANRIYNHNDNYDLVLLGKLTVNGAQNVNHPLVHNAWDATTPSFYLGQFQYDPGAAPLPRGWRYGGSGIAYGIRDPKFLPDPWPYKPDSYILISAGLDGLYGTEDDIHNY
ncbi:MAG: type II secretion system protein [Sedimentisphaerales bacterium]|nr:type II secretion system protein [Sedimentisphaerales bacterium]